MTSPSQPGTVLDGVRILVVEDDDAVVDLLDTALTARGASIVSVQSAVELLGPSPPGRFRLRCSTSRRSSRTSSATASAVRRANPDVRLVVMFGSAGADPLPANSRRVLVRKPFEIREIVEALVR